MLSHYEGGQRGLMIATKSISGVQHSGLEDTLPPSLSTPTQGTRGHTIPGLSTPAQETRGHTIPRPQYPGMGH